MSTRQLLQGGPGRAGGVNRPLAAAAGNNELVPTSRVGPELACIFEHGPSGFQHFNRVQSECFEEAFLKDRSLLISAPTGSGKTGVFELAICQLLTQQRELNPFSVVYFAPIKALCTEMSSSFQRKLAQVGVSVSSLTSDSKREELAAMKASLICATPEKYDSFSRTWSRQLHAHTKLVLIDEVHLLNEDRGSVLEACIARLRCRLPKVRIVAASATVTNPEDVATWLGADHRVFGEEYRPVQLTCVVKGFPSYNNSFLFNRGLAQHLGSIVTQYNLGRPALIFCATRKETKEDAQALINQCRNAFILDADHRRRLAEAAEPCRDSDLKACLRSAVGFHSAGLSQHDRNLVESLFISRNLLVICTTSTLSQGVNLPAHLVVIKSTLQYKGAGVGFGEYTPNMLRQMIGRAGRPQYDTSGTAVIMTEQKNVHKYETLKDGKEVIESQVLPKFLDMCCSEISSGLVENVGDLMLWVNHLYLSVRFKKNAAAYNEGRSIDGDRESMLRKLAMTYVSQLHECGMVKMADDGFVLGFTPRGKIAATHYIRVNSMKNMLELTAESTLSDIIACISRGQEFEQFIVKQNDKKMLRLLNEQAPYKRPPRKGGWGQVDQKIDCLLQGFISQELEQYESLSRELLMDARSIAEMAKRLCTGLIKLLRTEKQYFTPTLAAILLKKTLAVGGWKRAEGRGFLMHFQGVGRKGRLALESNKLGSIQKLRDVSMSQLQLHVDRTQALHIKAVLERFPIMRVDAAIANDRMAVLGVSERVVVVNVKLSINVDPQTAASKANAFDTGVVFLAGIENGPLCTYEHFPYSNMEKEQQLTLTVPDSTPSTGKIVMALVSEEFCGVESTLEIPLSYNGDLGVAPVKVPGTKAKLKTATAKKATSKAAAKAATPAATAAQQSQGVKQKAKTPATPRNPIGRQIDIRATMMQRKPPTAIPAAAAVVMDSSRSTQPPEDAGQPVVQPLPQETKRRKVNNSRADATKMLQKFQQAPAGVPSSSAAAADAQWPPPQPSHTLPYQALSTSSQPSATAVISQPPTVQYTSPDADFGVSGSIWSDDDDSGGDTIAVSDALTTQALGGGTIPDAAAALPFAVAARSTVMSAVPLRPQQSLPANSLFPTSNEQPALSGKHHRLQHNRFKHFEARPQRPPIPTRQQPQSQTRPLQPQSQTRPLQPQSQTRPLQPQPLLAGENLTGANTTMDYDSMFGDLL